MVKNGVRNHIQTYKCKACGKQFKGGERRDKNQVITDYVEGKQTREQLAKKYGVSAKTIGRDPEAMRYVQKVSKYKQVVIQMDTTYWGRNFGLMVIKDALRKRVLWRKYVRHETIADYMEGVRWLKHNGFMIYGVVIDGMRGLAQSIRPYPVQLCQFHQMLTIRHYLTQEPELEASKELLDLVNRITKMDKYSFSEAFELWYDKHKNVINERMHDKRFKKTPPYMRPRLRSAYLSLKRNMSLLWTFQDHPTIGLPNTNNGLEGIFSDIKTKLRVHSGISKEHRKKIIDEYLSRHY